MQPPSLRSFKWIFGPSERRHRCWKHTRMWLVISSSSLQLSCSRGRWLVQILDIWQRLQILIVVTLIYFATDSLIEICSFHTRSERYWVVPLLSPHKRWIADVFDPLYVLVPGPGGLRPHPGLKQMLSHILILKESLPHSVPKVMVVSIKLNRPLKLF